MSCVRTLLVLNAFSCLSCTLNYDTSFLDFPSITLIKIFSTTITTPIPTLISGKLWITYPKPHLLSASSFHIFIAWNPKCSTPMNYINRIKRYHTTFHDMLWQNHQLNRQFSYALITHSIFHFCFSFCHPQLLKGLAISNSVPTSIGFCHIVKYLWRHYNCLTIPP